MRIAYFAELFPVLSETPYLNIATGLLRRGHDVQVFAQAEPPGPKHPDVAALELAARTSYPALRRRAPWSERRRRAVALYREAPTGRHPMLRRALNPLRTGRRALSLEAFFEAGRFMTQLPFHAAYCAFGREGREAVRLRRLGAFDAPIAVSFRGRDITHDPRVGGPRLYRDVFREASLLLPMCHAFVPRLEALGAPREHIVVHPTGIDVRRFAFRAPTPPAPGEPLRLVSVARLREKKGLAYAIEAVGRLRASGVPVCYEIAGDGPLRAALERQVADAGLGDAVQLRGALPQAEVRALMDRSHLLLAPSVVASDGDEEGLPSVIKEALAVGLPVVATRHSGIPEIVIPGETGMLAPERDAEALERAIRDLLAVRDQWGAYAIRGRALVEREYDIEGLNDRLVTLLSGMRRAS
ncbi:MAG TPA: glycosyltransferase [Gemmatimonadales bacterium]|nr:glycosyltransferase [Gemmatimonadales bacterium]